ncbi:hypothetical protein ESA94_02720 [Lacibacter luteus]|uniref:Uncharacterized protein n=1 Tax=Lacibacter luteus TaxID=2508719 RepID=A0A4Q1CLQ6_9BACT|nr:hypothetical protein [Lacibacter luteus]RXK61943.1 hypothetical protein ESA94_02720 [Lacibacter luteus]
MKTFFPIIFFLAACTTKSGKVDNAQPTVRDTLQQQAAQVNKPNVNAESKIQTLILSYNAISCTCAQWSESKFNNDTSERVRYWLEPENTLLVNADTLYSGDNLPLQIQVTGRIVNENGYPVGANVEKLGLDEEAKVFMYTKIKVLKNGQKKKA